jgi:endonuclease-3
MVHRKPRPLATATPSKAAPAAAPLVRAVRKPKPKPEVKATATAVPEAGADEATVEAVFARLSAANPEPKPELEYVNPFTLLVAVVLSAQATDKGVNLATRPLFAVADTPQKMLALGEEGLREAIRTIGLYRMKATNVIALSRLLVERHGGEVPADRDVLETLPGVGRKTASVVANVAFHVPHIAVDTHIFRVSNRIPLAPGRTPEAVQIGLERIVPDRYRLHAHHWLILHGRYICKARRPECWRCPIEDLCGYEPKTPAPRVTPAPRATPAPMATPAAKS